MALLQTGQKIGGYEVKRLIKENHYCETYRVEDDKEEPFFLKLFILKNTPEKMLDANHHLTSIQLMSKLRHKNIASYVEHGTYQDDEVGVCDYVITNYFSGELLIDKIQREGKLPIEEALRIMMDVLEGVRYLHEHHLFHNDITPRNIMLSERTGGTAELIDMSHLSKYVCGNPPFDTSDLDERYHSNLFFAGLSHNATDNFSAIAVFYTMITGRVPWDIEFLEGTNKKERIKIVKEARLTPINLEEIDVAENIRRVLKRGLRVHGLCGYSDVELLMEDLHNPNRIVVELPPSPKPEPPQPSEVSSSEADEDVQTTGDEEQQGKWLKEQQEEQQEKHGNGFKDIAGMDDLKEMLFQKVIFILKDKEKAAKYKILPPNGMLFYGPPGCGKSFLAEKFAEETGFNFTMVKSSDLGSIYVHGTQEKIANLFKKAEEEGPTIICFDEFDAFVPNRSSHGGENQAGEVNEFLSQLNNCARRGIFVIATSNRPDMIDPAVLRTGRIDKMVYVPLPDRDARMEMFRLHLQDRPCEIISFERLADLTEGYIASDIAYIANDAAMGAAFSDQLISQEMLESTISSIHPSISKEVIASYERLRNKMEHVESRNHRPKIGFV